MGYFKKVILNLRIPCSLLQGHYRKNSLLSAKHSEADVIPCGLPQGEFIVNDGFSNPTGILDQGVEEYRGKISYNILKPTDIILDHYRRRYILSHMRTTYYGGEILNRWDRIALSGKAAFSRSKDQDTCTTTRRDKKGIIGLSYRPIACDRLNVIGKYEYKRKENIQIFSQESQTTNHIGSVEGAYDLTKNMTLGARYALNKSVEKGQDNIDKAHINLFVTSINYRLTQRLDVLTEGRYIYLHETGDWKLGSSIEIGYKPIKDLRLGVGYTFTEYADGDPAHNDQDYLSRGPYFKLTITPNW